MQLVYNGKEATGSGVIAMLNEQDSGITEFGKEVIDEMVKHGITVDFSHNSSMLINSTLDYMDSKYRCAGDRIAFAIGFYVRL
ncbi:hypothetical protein JCM19240_309 [Vibrio maritimus]|uniref:Membrane dipeptidase n=1 Tax=Vibrio maritimus TaxID=990268 RepID=A0A090TX43_9VIBR|nr:hypothetical protein JCM19240_309 [Vibrio maritimus]